MEARLTISNLNEVLGDLRKYDTTSRRAFQKTLFTTAKLMEQSQRQSLRAKVKKRTPNLEVAITAQKKNSRTWWIGPILFQVAYDWFIERGGPTPKGGYFAGYFYVEQSVKKYKAYFNSRLKNDIKKSVRK